jgi:hypothetical protein
MASTLPMSSSAPLMSNNNNNIDIVSWNVRGLNITARCLAVHQTIADNPGQIACLQETKLSSINSALASFLSAYRLTSFAFKPASGTRGHPCSLEQFSGRHLQRLQRTILSHCLRHAMTQHDCLHSHGRLWPLAPPGKRGFS